MVGVKILVLNVHSLVFYVLDKMVFKQLRRRGMRFFFFSLYGHLICCLAHMRTFSFQKQSENPGVGLCAVDASRGGQSQW